VVADLPVREMLLDMSMKTGGAGMAHTHKPPPSVFEEPESNSLLDSFGF
jgi:hypothetical protein